MGGVGQNSLSNLSVVHYIFGLGIKFNVGLKFYVGQSTYATHKPKQTTRFCRLFLCNSEVYFQVHDLCDYPIFWLDLDTSATASLCFTWKCLNHGRSYPETYFRAKLTNVARILLQILILDNPTQVPTICNLK